MDAQYKGQLFAAMRSFKSVLLWETAKYVTTHFSFLEYRTQVHNGFMNTEINTTNFDYRWKQVM